MNLAKIVASGLVGVGLAGILQVADASQTTKKETPAYQQQYSQVPSRLTIPSIGVNARVEQVGVTSSGEMGLPSSAWTVAWYNLGTAPGEYGNSVIAGHLDSRSGPAVFWSLRRLQYGDQVNVYSGDNQMTFEVQAVESYNYYNAPLQEIFGWVPDRNLNLITCNGTFDRSSANYNQRLVVYTRLIE